MATGTIKCEIMPGGNHQLYFRPCWSQQLRHNVEKVVTEAGNALFTENYAVEGGKKVFEIGIFVDLSLWWGWI